MAGTRSASSTWRTSGNWGVRSSGGGPRVALYSANISARFALASSSNATARCVGFPSRMARSSMVVKP